ncbi:putative reticulon-like protein RtnA short variant [Lipomyces tetrasporus]|uniref:Reticulon-like protein n=1 Tax=Lipomyces tetrasporus TaxID=54092 RepID=A0AAD7VSH4_9ASCO|nr:putative reticulon-like protein RtnA short variant [Lipomyces tetrasporus]KAJ8100091.1 putative reticulon-like protein RtnA short variant [Lipomyces tetrasporus]
MSESVPASSSAPSSPAVSPQFAKYKACFYDLLTWKNLYISGGSFAGALTTLYLFKYVNVIKLFFNFAYLALGTAIAVEFAGRTVKGGPGFVSSFRGSGSYFVISKDVVDPIFSEFTVLVNFLLVEFQQIVFVENFPLTVFAFVVSYFTYILVHYVSLWSLAVFGVIVAFSAPPVYLKFQKEIDAHVAAANKIIDEKTGELKVKANEHFGIAAGVAKGYVHQALDKVGYKRNLPPVPAPGPAATEPSPTNGPVTAE